MKQPSTYIYGKHAVAEALKNSPGAVEKIFTAGHPRDSTIDDILHAAKELKTPVGEKLPGEVMDMVHQGIAASINPSKILKPYKSFIEGIEITPDTLFVLLGELSDLHNVGAVIRSAAGLGAAAVLIPEHNQAPITGTVVKVSAGMAFTIPLIEVGNVNTTLRDLKARGFWVYGLEGESKKSLADENFDAPTVLILGNEATGVREKTRELCDVLLSVPMNPRCESLNAAASAAIAMYEWAKKHPKALRKSL